MQPANQGGREVSVCGDMAHKEQYLPFLLGIGVRVLSIDPRYLLRIQQAISKINLPEAQATAEKMLSQSKISDLAQSLNLTSAYNEASLNEGTYLSARCRIDSSQLLLG